MKRLIMLTLLLAGCDSGIQPGSAQGAGSNPLFPEVNDRIRVACTNWIQNDASLATVISAFDADRQAGFTKQQAFLDVANFARANFADDPVSTTAYITCMGAIIDEVWP